MFGGWLCTCIALLGFYRDRDGWVAFPPSVFAGYDPLSAFVLRRTPVLLLFQPLFPGPSVRLDFAVCRPIFADMRLSRRNTAGAMVRARSMPVEWVSSPGIRHPLVMRIWKCDIGGFPRDIPASFRERYRLFAKASRGIIWPIGGRGRGVIDDSP